MGRKRHTPEQIITALREAEVGLARGKSVKLMSRELGITEQTYYRWRREYGGMKVSQARRLKELERENGRLKREVLADLFVRHGPPEYLRSDNGPEVQREARAAVVGARGRRDALYRAGQPVGERLQRELQRQAQGRAVERGDLLLVGAGGRAGRAMEARVQYRPTPQRLRRLSPGP